jgi:hypothetical protein
MGMGIGIARSRAPSIANDMPGHLGRQSAPDEPHPQHRNFVRMFIPTSLSMERRSGFLAGISDSEATPRLQEAWNKFGAGVLPPEMLLPPAGLSVSGFRYDKFLCFLIIFPPPEAIGEAFFGLVIAGPSDNWSPEARPKIPVRYFILERSAASNPTIFEWRPTSTEPEEEVFEDLGGGPLPDNPPDFAEAILARFCGYNSHA